jgi:hypothetical protein
MPGGHEELRPDLRAQLEQVAEAIGLGVGQTELVTRYQDGRLKWWETRRVRVPASELGKLRPATGP